MAKKRFTDVEIWNKEWFMDLSPKLKCLIRYLFDNCDAAGVWTPNWKLASLHIGEPTSEKDLKLLPQDQYEIFDGKIFLPDFINFQYGQLSESSPAHKPVFASLKKNNLSNRVFNRVSNSLQEKDKDKEKDKEEDKDFGKSENLLPVMFRVFKKKKPHYPDDQVKDFHALKDISAFICKQSGISYQPSDKDVGKTVFDAWEVITDYLVKDDFYGNKSLKTISNNIQSIVQKIQHESTGGKTSGKPGSKVTGSQLDAALAKFRNKGQPVGHT